MDNKSRRDFLKHSSLGVSGAALAGVIPGLNISAASAAELIDPLAPKDPHFQAKIKSVIWLSPTLLVLLPLGVGLFDYAVF